DRSPARRQAVGPAIARHATLRSDTWCPMAGAQGGQPGRSNCSCCGRDKGLKVVDQRIFDQLRREHRAICVYELTKVLLLENHRAQPSTLLVEKRLRDPRTVNRGPLRALVAFARRPLLIEPAALAKGRRERDEVPICRCQHRSHSAYEAVI